MPDIYRNFTELAKREKEGHDFARLTWKRNSPIAIIAPHGGGIEPGTSELAAALAGDNFSLYCFEGLKRLGSRRLHIASTRFDEPNGLDLVQNSSLAVALHGCSDPFPMAYIGGLHANLQHLVIQVLKEADFPAKKDETHHPGREASNICNRCLGGQGLQIELSHGLRRLFFAGLASSQRGQVTPRFWAFIRTLRAVFLGIHTNNLW